MPARCRRYKVRLATFFSNLSKSRPITGSPEVTNHPASGLQKILQDLQSYIAGFFGVELHGINRA